MSIQVKLFFSLCVVIVLTILFLIIINNLVLETLYIYNKKDSAKDLYEQIKRRDIIPAFEELREQMFEEQGGICCYCGCVLAKQHCSNEHLKPKSRYVELVGEYKNMVLSCRTSQQEQKEIAREMNKQKDTHIKLSKERKKHYHCSIF